MAALDHRQSYKPIAIALHWLVALLVFATIPAGVIMLEDDLPRATQDALFIFHKNVGVLIFLLVLARIAFRIFNPPPPLPVSVPHTQRVIALATHIALYGLLLTMSVSGYIYVVAGDFPLESLDAIGFPRLVAENEDVSETAQAIHVTVRWVLIAMMALHIGAALFHGLVRRDGVFSSMAPFVKR